MKQKAKVSYVNLQKKYPGQVVALNQRESKVLAAGKDVVEIEKKLQKKGFSPEEVIFLGPIEQYGRICVY